MNKKSWEYFWGIYWLCYWHKWHVNINVTILIYFSINILNSQYFQHDSVVNTISIICYIKHLIKQSDDFNNLI